MSFDPKIESEQSQWLSNCCSSPVDEDYMICHECKEPCDIVEFEEDVEMTLGSADRF